MSEPDIIAAIRARQAIYIARRDQSDQLAGDDCNAYERRDFAVECFDRLLQDIGEQPTEDRE